MRVPFVSAFAIVLVFSSVVHGQGIQLRVASNPRAEFVSGGDVLVSVALPAGTQPSSARLTLNGTDITSALRADAAGRTMLALVTHSMTEAIRSWRPQARPCRG